MTHITIGILTPEGLIPAPYTAASLAEAVAWEPDGIYTLGRTFHRDQALLFGDHMARLAESASLEGIPLLLDSERLRAALRQLIEQAGYAESRFRITIPRATPAHVIISLEPFTPPDPAIYAQGVQAALIRDLARRNPAAKTTAWMTERKAASTITSAPGVYEGLLVNGAGEILEGTSSNFYAVLDGRLHTAGEGVLSGTAQKVVFKVLPADVPLVRSAVKAEALWALEEAFLTSASRGVVPIVRIDHQIIGTGEPGPITRRIGAAYDAWVEAHLEPI